MGLFFFFSFLFLSFLSFFISFSSQFNVPLDITNEHGSLDVKYQVTSPFSASHSLFKSCCQFLN